MNLTFLGSDAREGDVRSFKFRSDSPLKWTAGQYIHYTLAQPAEDDRGNERWFTISSAPSEGDVVITTRISAEGGSAFKRVLGTFRIGDKIQADEPEGDFVLEDPTRNYIFVAGGIGITPFRSILVEAEAKGEQPHVELLYANRTEDVAFRQELKRLQKSNPNLRVRYIIQPDRLDKKVLSDTISATDNPMVYISGPEPMVEALTDEVAGLGVSKENIKSDYFPGYPAE